MCLVVVSTHIVPFEKLSSSIPMQCFFDTPGLSINSRGIPYKDFKVRVESAWSSVNLYDVLIVIFDVHRHLTRLVIHCILISCRLYSVPDPIIGFLFPSL